MTNELDLEARYTLEDFPGIAFYVHGYQQLWEPYQYLQGYEADGTELWIDCDHEGEWVDSPDKLIVVMVGDDRKHLVDILPSDSKRLLAGLAHSDTVCKNTHLFQGYTTTAFQGLIHAGRFIRLYADHLYLRSQRFHDRSNTCNQTTTTHRDKNSVGQVGVLPKYLHRNGALTGNHLWIIKGVNKCHAALFAQLLSMDASIIIRVAMQHNFCTEAAQLTIHIFVSPGDLGDVADDGGAFGAECCQQQ